MSLPPTPPDPRHSDGIGSPADEVALPISSSELVRLAQNPENLTMEESRAVAHVALDHLRRQLQNTEGPATPPQIAEAIRTYAIREIMRIHQRNLRERSRAEADALIDQFLEGEMADDTAQDQEEDQEGDPEEDLEEDQEGDPEEDLEEDQEEELITIPNSVQVKPDGDSLQWLKSNHVTTEEEIIDGLSRLKFSFTDEALQRFFGGRDPYQKIPDASAVQEPDPNQRDILTALCSHPVLAVELGKHLAPKDILNLFLSCRTFNNFVKGYMLSSIRTWVEYQCPKAGETFPYRIYKPLLISDPRGRTWEGIELDNPAPEDVRSIPSLKYLQLLWTRDRCSRDIMAIMARNGHRLPKTMYTTLLRLWLLMDLSTSTQRRALMRNKEIWTDYDLYNAQLFFVKLGMYFNDPVYGPGTMELLQLMMGQRGLYPLWQLLMRKRFTTLPEILQLKVQYDLQMPANHWGHNFFGQEVHDVPFAEIGTVHREGWGTGRGHLQRPDELVPLEAVHRGLELDEHLPHMILWGYFDWNTGENLVPTEEEMYIPDEETALKHMDTTHHWKKRHAMKKRWTKLTPEEKQAIIDDDEDETLRALAWVDDDDDDDAEGYSSGSDSDAPYNPNDEITRGFVMPPCPADRKSTVPATNDKKGWSEFVNTALVGMAPEVDEDDALLAQACEEYGDDDFDDEFNWDGWLAQETQAVQTQQDSEEEDMAPDLEDESSLLEDDSAGEDDSTSEDDSASEDTTMEDSSDSQ